MCSSKGLQLVCIVAAIFIVVITSLVAVIFVWPAFVGQQMIEEQLFKNGTVGMDRFLNSTKDRDHEIHFMFFNITNADQFKAANGMQKLQLQQVGPFIFREFKSIELLVNNQTAGLITYKQRRRFVYDEKRSIGDFKKLKVTWLNVPVLSLMGFIDRNQRTSLVNEAKLLALHLQYSLNSVSESLFITDTVENFLFAGSFRRVLDHMRRYFQRDFEKRFNRMWLFPDDRFGFYYGVNDTWNSKRDYNFTVMSGHGLGQNHNNLNQIKLMNGSQQLRSWNNIISNCNQLNGTDGRFFKPYLESSEKLTVFQADICRKIELIYNNSETIDGISAYRYTMDERSFMSPAKNFENVCYCLDNDGIRANCDLDGLVNMAGCIGENIFASAPNFFGGSESLTNRLVGLRPRDARFDEPFTFSIEPFTGLPIQSRVALQYNVKLAYYSKNWTQFNWLKTDETLFVPLFHMTQTTAMRAELKLSLLTLDLKYISIIIVSIVTFLLIVFLIILSISVNTTQKLPKSISVGNSRRLSLASNESRPNRLTISATRRSSDSGLSRNNVKAKTIKLISKKATSIKRL